MTAGATRVDAWGLGELVALAGLACGEWSPRLPLFDPGRYDPPPQPRWWGALSRVWLYPRGGRVWAWACDSHSECAFDLSSRAGTSWAGDPSPVGVPRDALLALAGRSPRGGVRVEADGGSLSVSALSSGYTGRVSASRPSPFEAMAAPPEVEGLIGKTMAARGEAVSGGAGEGLEAVASAADLGRAFSCLGARLRHSRHAPAVVRVDRAGRVVAVEGLGGPGCVMRCAGRPWGDGL